MNFFSKQKSINNENNSVSLKFFTDHNLKTYRIHFTNEISKEDVANTLEKLLDIEDKLNKKDNQKKNAILLLIVHEKNNYCTRILNYYEIPLQLFQQKPNEQDYYFLLDHKAILKQEKYISNSNLQINKHFDSIDIIEKGVLLKRSRIGELKEKYFSLTKDFFLYIDLKKKTKKMRVLDLSKCSISLLPQTNEYNMFEVKESKKIYHLKADSQSAMRKWVENIESQIRIVKETYKIKDLEEKTSQEEKVFSQNNSNRVFSIFERIENVFEHRIVLLFYFEYILEINPDLNGLILLMVLYKSFLFEYKQENFERSFFFIRQIFEILEKIITQELTRPIIKRERQETKLISPSKKVMYHNSKVRAQKEKEPEVFQELNDEKRYIKQRKNSKQLYNDYLFVLTDALRKDELNIFKRKKAEELNFIKLIFPEEIDHLIKNLDWQQVKSSFSFMKIMVEQKGINSTVKDIFGEFFEKAVSFLTAKFYKNFLKSDFLKSHLVLVQVLNFKKQRNNFELPSFKSKHEKKEENIVFSSKKLVKSNLDLMKLHEMRNSLHIENFLRLSKFET